MIQAFSLIYKFFNIASPCGDMIVYLDIFKLFCFFVMNDVSQYKLSGYYGASVWSDALWIQN